jgi:hypothetical protein
MMALSVLALSLWSRSRLSKRSHAICRLPPNSVTVVDPSALSVRLLPNNWLRAGSVGSSILSW